MPDKSEATRLWPRWRKPWLELYRGVTAISTAHMTLTPPSSNGSLRSECQGRPGGRAIAGLREPWGENLAVGFVAGQAERCASSSCHCDSRQTRRLDHVTVALPLTIQRGDMTLRIRSRE